MNVVPHPTAPAAPRVFVQFWQDHQPADVPDAEYAIDDVRVVSGEPLDPLDAARPLYRRHFGQEIGVAPRALIGSTQHVVYTDARDKTHLGSISATESGPRAVLIPIAKSDAWWALAQDERLACFRGAGGPSGHLSVGTPYAARIYRRLYHARYLPGSSWDFLTYFEFPDDATASFQRLLDELRDPAKNPEWAYVRRETEVWMTKLVSGSRIR
jgi:hypothetical protein